MGGDVSRNFKIVEQVDLSGLVSCPAKDRGLSWSLARAVAAADGLDSSAEEEEFSLFDYGVNYSQYNNAVKFMRSIRHPNIMAIFCDPVKRKPDGVRFATQPVEPLVRVLPKLDFQEVMGGIHDIIRALSFLHISARICHNAVGLQSIFVTKDGTWKLGCFESAHKVQDSGVIGDVKNLASLLEVLLEKLEDFGAEDLQSLVDLRMEIENMISSSSSSLNINTCLSSQVFQKYKFIKIRTFLAELMVKNAEEKATFFGSLISELCLLPEELVARRLSVPLLQRFVLLDKTARKFFLPSFLTPKEASAASLPGTCPVLRTSLFQGHVLPVLIKVFTVRDLIVRTALLESFSRYCRSFSRQQLQDVVLNELLLSARDQNDLLVELSLRALADLVCILGGDLVIGSQRVQYFYDGQIKEQIHSQTTIASGFDPATLESGKNPVRKTQEKLDRLLKVDHKLDPMRDARKSNDCRKVLVNTVNLSDQKVKTSIQKADSKNRKEKTNPDLLSEEEDESQPTLLRKLENRGADDCALADMAQLEDDDLVRSKSLENLYKNQTKPIAVIEPKTTYQLANQPSPDSMKANDSDNEHSKKEADPATGSDNFSRPAVQNKSNSIQESAERLRNIPRDSWATGNNKAVTLLDISQSSTKIQSKPLGLKKSSQGMTGNVDKPVLDKHQDEVEDDNSEWGDKWEDLEIQPTSEGQPKTPTRPSCSSSDKLHASLTNSRLFHEKAGVKQAISSRDQLNSNGSHRPLEKPKASRHPNHHFKISEEPLGFGYDIKQIKVKVKSGALADEDDEWKLFEDLIPEPQKISYDYNPSHSKTLQDGQTGIEDTEQSNEPSEPRWEAEELDLDLD